MLTKLNFVHLSPRAQPLGAGLVTSPEHWRYSSAHERLEGRSRSCDVIPGSKAADDLRRRRRRGGKMDEVQLREQVRSHVKHGNEGCVENAVILRASRNVET